MLDAMADSPERLARELRERPDCPDDEAMSRFLSGRCDPGERRRILRHVMTCDACLAAVDDLTAPARAEARAAARGFRPAAGLRARRLWSPARAMGFAAPLAAACVLAAVVFSRPALRMELEVTRSAMRTESTLSVDDGGVLHPGDRFRVEISALEDGYFFLYAWNQVRGGKFIFPLEGFGDDNRIRKGQSTFNPDEKGWLLEDAEPGTETFFLMFSERAVPAEYISGLDVRLARVSGDRSAVEGLLGRHFSIEQRFSYHVE